MSHLYRILYFSLLFGVLGGTPSASHAASFELLLPGPVYGYVKATGISGDGTTVVGDCTSGPDSGMSVACRWTAATGWQGLGYLPGHDISYASGVSADGAVVVGRSFSTNTLENQAFRWTRSGGMKGLGFLPDTDESSAAAVSANGGVVAGISGGEPFRWTQAGGMQGFGFLPGYASIEIRGISADGAVVVGRGYGSKSSPSSAFPGEAFRWTRAGGMQGLGFLPSPFDFTSSARAASADGSVVVGSSSRYDGDWVYGQAVVWRQSCGCMQGLGFLSGGVSSGANDLSADGTVIVGSSGERSGDGSYHFRAVVWTPGGGLQKLADILQSQGIVLPRLPNSAGAVSADGRWIVGTTVRDASDQVYPFRAYIGPDGDTLAGTSGPDELTGTPGDDVIDGKGGADVMTGLQGNDTYVVDNIGDAVVEAAIEGADTVKSSVTYALSVNVENLILTGTVAINGSGNSRNNTLIGNSANNVLNGKASADQLRGRGGDDQLIGGPGADTLTGGAGHDRFVFNAALGSTNIDRITDFTPADDTIRLENAVFKGLPATGSLAAAAFATGTAATTAAHRILYDPTTGNVWYDADGTGPTPAVRFAQLTTQPALTRADFVVQ